MVEPSEAWQEALARCVGGRVARYRKARGLTAQQLSDRMRSRLGFDMKRAVIGNLETGIRRTVGLAEIYALAYALGVPPLLLVVPVGEAEFEVLPGVHADPWLVARWVTGEAPPEWESPRVSPAEGVGDDELLEQYRMHDQLLDEWFKTADRPQPAPNEAGVREDPLGLVEDMVGVVRRQIRYRKAVPPPLPIALAHLEPQEEGTGHA